MSAASNPGDEPQPGAPQPSSSFGNLPPPGNDDATTPPTTSIPTAPLPGQSSATVALPQQPPATSAPASSTTSRPVQPASISGSAGSAPRHLTPIPIAWRSWPVVDSIPEFICLAGAMVGVPYVVFDATGNLLVTVLCTAALATVIWRSFLPTTFEIGALGVTERFLGRTQRIPWISIDRFVVGRKGAFLSSSGAPLEALRGVYLPWGPHRDQVLATLRYYLPRAEDPPPSPN